MLETIEQIMIDKRISIRIYAPLDEESDFCVAAFDVAGMVVGAGSGETLSEALHAMLEDLGVLEGAT